jgi:protoporphyrinogen oxidase
MPTAAPPPDIAPWDLVVLGAGPAGLGAALHAVRAGARVTVVDAADTVGGLCVTRRHGDMRYDLGGHIPFVNDAAREQWLRELLGDDLIWVPQPVASVRGGQIRPGRYLDQRPGAAPLGTPLAVLPVPGPADSARDVLDACFGGAFVDAELRSYLEKIDGVPLERIPGARPLRLMLDQAAPAGFWFPRLGIGQLMDAMAREIAARGGRVMTGTRVTEIDTRSGAVRGVALADAGSTLRIITGRLIVSAPPGAVAARLVPPPAPLPPVRMRAVALVYIEVSAAPLIQEAWVQVDTPAVPAARIVDARNWSPDMCPPGRTVIGMECYCMPTPDDPVWSASDAELAARCIATLRAPLGWLEDTSLARPIEVVRLPAGYPVPDLTQAGAMAAAPAVLDAVEGLWLARGSAVIDAIHAGEVCANTALGTAR